MDANTLKTIYEAQCVDRRATWCMLRTSKSMPAGTFRETNRWRIWIWSDLHLGHRLSIGHFKRPFVDEEQMDQALHRAWRETVNSGDTLICLGDVALPGLWGRRLAKFRKAPGRKILVYGNHDVNRLGEVDVEGFEEIHPTLYAGGDPPLLMTHMPLRHVPDGCVNVHRHTHNAALTRTRHVNVSVEQIRYRPVEFEAIRRLARELVAGRYPAGNTTVERLDNLASGNE